MSGFDNNLEGEIVKFLDYPDVNFFVKQKIKVSGSDEIWYRVMPIDPNNKDHNGTPTPVDILVVDNCGKPMDYYSWANKKNATNYQLIRSCCVPFTAFEVIKES